MDSYNIVWYNKKLLHNVHLVTILEKLNGQGDDKGEESMLLHEFRDCLLTSVTFLFI